MTADLGSEAGAAGISAELGDSGLARALRGVVTNPRESRSTHQLVPINDAIRIANEHAAAATARAEKLEREVAMLRKSTAIAHSALSLGRIGIDLWPGSWWPGDNGNCTCAVCVEYRAALAEPARREGET
jgi:hypothetical protein